MSQFSDCRIAVRIVKNFGNNYRCISKIVALSSTCKEKETTCNNRFKVSVGLDISTGLWVVMTTNYLHPKIKCIDYQRYLCNESCEWCQRNTNVCYSDHSCKSITRTSKFHQVYFPNQMPLTKRNNIFIRRRNNIFIFRFILQTTCTRKNKLS